MVALFSVLLWLFVLFVVCRGCLFCLLDVFSLAGLLVLLCFHLRICGFCCVFACGLLGVKIVFLRRPPNSGAMGGPTPSSTGLKTA